MKYDLCATGTYCLWRWLKKCLQSVNETGSRQLCENGLFVGEDLIYGCHDLVTWQRMAGAEMDNIRPEQVLAIDPQKWKVVILS